MEQEDESTTGAAATLSAATVPSFVMKVHNLVETASNDIIEWTSEGAAFVIKDENRLESEFLHQFFNHQKFSSFRRQLSFYGFRKRIRYHVVDHVNATAARCSEYRHVYFRRGRMDLLAKIRRKSHGTTSHELKDLEAKADSLRCRVDALESLVAELYERREEASGYGGESKVAR